MCLKSHRAVRQQPTVILSSAGWWGFFPPGRMKASKFQHNGGVVVHVKDGKICLTKEVCKLTRDKDGMSLLTVAEKTDVSSCLAKHTQKNYIFFKLCIVNHFCRR